MAGAVSGLDGDVRRFPLARGDLPSVAFRMGVALASSCGGPLPARNRPGEGSGQGGSKASPLRHCPHPADTGVRRQPGGHACDTPRIEGSEPFVTEPHFLPIIGIPEFGFHVMRPSPVFFRCRMILQPPMSPAPLPSDMIFSFVGPPGSSTRDSRKAGCEVWHVVQEGAVEVGMGGRVSVSRGDS